MVNTEVGESRSLCVGGGGVLVSSWGFPFTCCSNPLWPSLDQVAVPTMSCRARWLCCSIGSPCDTLPVQHCSRILPHAESARAWFCSTPPEKLHYLGNESLRVASTLVQSTHPKYVTWILCWTVEFLDWDPFGLIPAIILSKNKQKITRTRGQSILSPSLIFFFFFLSLSLYLCFLLLLVFFVFFLALSLSLYLCFLLLLIFFFLSLSLSLLSLSLYIYKWYIQGVPIE